MLPAALRKPALLPHPGDAGSYVAPHNEGVSQRTELRPIPVFTAATRAVRDAATPPAIKQQAFQALEALAASLSCASAPDGLGPLVIAAAQCRQLEAALAPHMAPLQQVVTACFACAHNEASSDWEVAPL